jgi:hypothetical protein
MCFSWGGRIAVVVSAAVYLEINHQNMVGRENERWCGRVAKKEDGNFHNVMLLTVRLLVANIIKMNRDMLLPSLAFVYNFACSTHTPKNNKEAKTFCLADD